jgi:hypothetical protein
MTENPFEVGATLGAKWTYLIGLSPDEDVISFVDIKLSIWIVVE